MFFLVSNLANVGTASDVTQATPIAEPPSEWSVPKIFIKTKKLEYGVASDVWLSLHFVP